MRDCQKGRVYAWERANIDPHDTVMVPFDQIASVVGYVWEKQGLQFPPRVVQLHVKSKNAGQANRLEVQFPKQGAKTWVILHELAHSMSMTHNGMSNGHGALFMGIYLRLLERFLRLDYERMIATAERAGLHLDREAVPVFL